MTLSIEEFAAASLETPDSFYTSSEEAYVTHGVVAGITRDSEILDQSNWAVTLQELGITKVENVRPATGNPCGLGTHTHDYEEPNPDDCFVMTSSHWACGWVDTLMVRVYKTEGSEEFTSAFVKAYELFVAKEDYPVLDEEDYSEREYQDTLDTLKSCYDVPQEMVGDAYAYLSENHDVCRGDDIRDENVYEWYTAAHLEAPEWLASRYKAEQDV